ncbi:flagellar assembly peptidoglycan hydrolase FlgJ [Marinibactrum halimedae]|uniref:Peptidoglycan hydrolase FlgJ n=1 Tax=Marinibactrum halimedae TaxID=1444977 RepID=A0AA37T6V9_9GAMM|nr:flagellar assembly peptidoglycan hydrolase FlgJ [Marinibactrum halimedae]MCD9458386.1 flagellar assembly peptidoglycan hydrolase FlgJ [Marinibactrum halimedae]GLS26083.1 peptidoglycan hydrolase FlgJ [Marinibactrum halimedae]
MLSTVATQKLAMPEPQGIGATGKTTQPNSADTFTDLSSLQDIKSLGREKNPEAFKRIAQQFESYFMQEMMKTMRASVDVLAKDNPLNSSEMQFHQQMFDQQMALSLSSGKGLGLADTLAKQLMQNFDVDWAEDAEKNKEGLAINSSRESLTFQKRQPSSSIFAGSMSVEKKPIEILDVDAESINNNMPSGWKVDTSSPEAFVRSLLPLAEKLGKQIGVDSRAIVAQAALETGWGKHIIERDGQSSFNLFNIKADARWSGDRVTVNTLEFQDGVAKKTSAAFRAYTTVEESFNDYAQFLQDNPRYQMALQQGDDPEQYVKQLQSSGYATDPKYAEKIIAILERPEFSRSSLLLHSGEG